MILINRRRRNVYIRAQKGCVFRLVLFFVVVVFVNFILFIWLLLEKFMEGAAIGFINFSFIYWWKTLTKRSYAILVSSIYEAISLYTFFCLVPMGPIKLRGINNHEMVQYSMKSHVELSMFCVNGISSTHK